MMEKSGYFFILVDDEAPTELHYLCLIKGVPSHDYIVKEKMKWMLTT
jgi:hypothetical protein